METKTKQKAEKKEVLISKNLAYILRHGAKDLNIPISKDGLVEIDLLLNKHINCTQTELEKIVYDSTKKRFEIIDINDKKYIRACQGHSITGLDFDSLMKKITNAEQFANIPIVHGTVSEFWDSIIKEGLKKMSRNHIHFSQGYAGKFYEKNDYYSEPSSGMRNDCDILIELDLNLVLQNGIDVYLSNNGVILTAGINGIISPLYFKKVFKWEKKTKNLIFENTNLNSLKPLYTFKYLMVLDFEANCVEKEQKYELEVQEIIEFPVVPIDTEKIQIINDKIFHHYIKPKYTKIDKFCTQLTGITQSVVDKGIPLEEALKKFDEYLIQNNFDPKQFCIVTCGKWDLNTCLRREARYKKINLPNYLMRYINLKDVFKTAYFKLNPPKNSFAEEKCSMTDMLTALNIQLDGKHHSGIDDSRNIAKIVIQLLKMGKLITKSYMKNTDERK